MSQKKTIVLSDNTVSYLEQSSKSSKRTLSKQIEWEISIARQLQATDPNGYAELSRQLINFSSTNQENLS